MNVHFCVNRCPPLNCATSTPGRSSVDMESIEDNELGAANERVSLLKEEESTVDLSSNNSSEKTHSNDKLLNRVDQIDTMTGNSQRTKLLNKNEENNRVRRETQRNHKFDRDDKRKTMKTTNNHLIPDAALQREIAVIVEGLSSNDHDYQARSLYTRGKKILLFLEFRIKE